MPTRDSRHRSALGRRPAPLAVAVALALAAALAPGVLAAAPPEVGDRVPDLRLEDLAGASHVLSEWIERGPVVLVFFRGVW